MAHRHIAYFDESGDHGLETIDPEFPAFVLCGCVYEIDEYRTIECPNFSAIKFKHFGHDAVVMHSRKIRKHLGPFKILQDKAARLAFMKDIAQFMENSKATIVAAAIRKAQHKDHYKYPMDPYEVALLFCLERLYGCMVDRREEKIPLVCIFEQRGEADDKRLARVFATACNGANRWGKQFPFQMVFANKQQNMPGLQVADLAAYPIARYVIDPAAKNPAYDIVRKRFRTGPNGNEIGWGLKVFP